MLGESSKPKDIPENSRTFFFSFKKKSYSLYLIIILYIRSVNNLLAVLIITIHWAFYMSTTRLVILQTSSHLQNWVQKY